MKKENFTRETLYELVWNSSLLSLSKKYAISDNGLRKICRRMDVPLPANGHWQKIKFTQKIKRSKLPVNTACEQTFTLEFRPTDESGNPIQSSSVSPRNIFKQQIESTMPKALVVPDRLTNPYPLIIAAKQELETHEDYKYPAMQSSGRGLLDILVARSNIGRALRFMDTLIKALNLKGYSITFRNGDTHVSKGEDEFRIQLREKMTRTTVKGNHYDTYEYHPTGILSFQDGRYSSEWKDGKVKLEAKLPDIVAEFELMSADAAARRIQHQINETVRKEKQRIQQAFEELRRQDLIKFRELMEKANRWHTANNLRNYIAEVEQKAVGESGLSEPIKSWLQWAQQKINWYDPFIEQEDELLTEVSRETLSLKENNSTRW